MASSRLSRETRLSLLEDTKSYLGSLLEETASDSVLVYAWDEFYRIYDALIRRFVVSQGVPHSDVDDCVQEVWSEVVERLVKFERSAHRPGLLSHPNGPECPAGSDPAGLPSAIRCQGKYPTRHPIPRSVDCLLQFSAR